MDALVEKIWPELPSLLTEKMEEARIAAVHVDRAGKIVRLTMQMADLCTPAEADALAGIFSWQYG